MSRDRMFSLQQLHRRGWSPKMVRRFLGAPDTARRNAYNPAGPGLQLYDAQRARAIEAIGEFCTAKTARRRRAQAGRLGAETRRRNLRQRAAALVVDVEVMDPADIRRRAIDWHNGQQQRQARRLPGFTPLLVNQCSAPDVLCEVQRRFAAAALARFDPTLIPAAKRAGAADVVETVAEKVGAAVAAAYPHLNANERT